MNRSTPWNVHSSCRLGSVHGRWTHGVESNYAEYEEAARMARGVSVVSVDLHAAGRAESSMVDEARKGARTGNPWVNSRSPLPCVDFLPAQAILDARSVCWQLARPAVLCGAEIQDGCVCIIADWQLLKILNQLSPYSLRQMTPSIARGLDGVTDKLPDVTADSIAFVHELGVTFRQPDVEVVAALIPAAC